ncbi:DNA polymerase III subunit epsilon [Candidatus Enterovibrio escicola]|uniref:DNA polymerase III subunit epsilon n=1 Tax=Candidatus Enterovibrio escicola TaxID=1927127 RepID=A0A2A5T0M6_9GAMM|nr:DNA polymerase III subunit epsilon [Candidatus Enterovibrio escacola]PCS21715.1 DNA polymerase III epsilon subunit [Candidatus Enterovibrio escacola]
MKASYERIIVLDTETTGMNRDSGPHYEGHRIIEIGVVEIIKRKLTGKNFHVYIKPDREIDPEAIAIHGITDAFLVDKPTYADVHQEFLEFIRGAEIVAHNVNFDVGFMDHEFQMLGKGIGKTQDFCKITDSLAMAKKIFPGKRNNLDVLTERYGIDNSHRTLHGALLDAEILADIYLLMTGGQTVLVFRDSDEHHQDGKYIRRVEDRMKSLKIIYASADDVEKHNVRLDTIEKNGKCLWR